MTIEETDFKLEQTSVSSTFWDLYLLKTIKPKGCASRQELTLDSYGVTLDYAIRKIALFRLHCKYEEQSITMKEFLKEYRDIINQLTNFCKTLPEDPAIEESNA